MISYPSITGMVPSVTFAESEVNSLPQLIDSDVTFLDPSGFGGGTLVLTGLLDEDVCSVRDQGAGAGQIGFDAATGTISYGGIAIGAASGGVGDSLSITLNASATSAAIDALIQNLTFSDASDTPTASRTLTLQVTNAAGVAMQGPPGFVLQAGAANPFAGIGVSEDATPAFGDFDNDGDLDLVVGSDSDGFRFFVNTGDGGAPTFAQGTGLPGLGAGSYDVSASFADIDGDGDLDAATGGVGTGLGFYRNTGGTSAPQFVSEPAPWGALPSTYTNFAFGDLDGDGDLDGIVGGAYEENVGDVHHASFIASDRQFEIGDGRASLGDVDADGDLDLVVGNNDGSLSYYENVGGSSAPDFVERVGGASPFVAIHSSSYQAAPQLVDLNADGRVDLVLGDHDGTIAYYLNEVAPGWSFEVHVTPENDPPVITSDGIALNQLVEAGVAFGIDAAVASPVIYSDADDAAAFDVSGWTQQSAETYSRAGMYGVATLDVVSGVVTYELDNDDPDTNALKQGQVATDAFALVVRDASGASVSTEVDFMIDGANDAPTLSGGAPDGVLVEAGVTSLGRDTATTSAISISDPDSVTAALVTDGWSEIGLGSQYRRSGTYGDALLDLSTGIVTYSLHNNDPDTESLAEGQTAIDVFLIRGSDAEGALAELQIVFSIQGAYDGITGGPTGDSLSGTSASDYVRGFGGDDTIDGGPGADTLDGGAGSDTVDFSTAGRRVTADLDAGWSKGGAGSDVIISIENAIGSSLADTLLGTDGANSLFGGEGDNYLDGREGDDLIVGGDDDDQMLGASGFDRINGQGGDDIISAGRNDDTIDGGGGDDQIDAGSGSDFVSGGDGDDIIMGRSGSDTLDGGRGEDSLGGGSGDDLLIAGRGADVLNGGSGFDAVTYVLASTGIAVDLSSPGSIGDGGADGDSFRSIEGITGSELDDLIIGSRYANALNGEAGDDTLVGGSSGDTLSGGGGSDTFIYVRVKDSSSSDGDKITDLEAIDLIDLSAIDADTGVAGNQSFHLVTNFTGTAGEARLQFHSSEALTYLELDLDGDGSADMTIYLAGNQESFSGLVL